MSVKQLLIDMSVEARAEVRKFLDELEGLNQESAVIPEESAAKEEVKSDVAKKADSDENPEG